MADVPVFHGASALADVADLIGVLAGGARCLGMVVTEFNPDHAHPDAREAQLLVSTIARAITSAAPRP